ncbi:uncharacterized protein EI90DRAFT_3061411 [Cantharellus anzutake]|uniref:uncharacterized protein n=1 Tax=Cantharellus anzutake TaxID=1750568 RepID=UPI0019048AD5|nr:uncharacterized protein EI90DRAFT_3061411 [Cantharellus anzutake]KAF8330061.1 hypothetical protein EI90DRAFT_3061411 [Cantharellus anzutake]
MTLFDNLIGGYLSGIVFATTLLGATTIQAYWYFARFPKDPSWNKLLVIFLIGAQFLNLGCMMKTMYGLLVQSLGRAFTRNPWSGSSYLLVNAVSSVLVHFFFVGRIRKLTKIRWLPATIAVASLSMLGFAVEVSVNG